MAQTGNGKKKVYVHTYTKEDGTKVPTHYRSTPNTSTGKRKINNPQPLAEALTEWQFCQCFVSAYTEINVFVSPLLPYRLNYTL